MLQQTISDAGRRFAPASLRHDIIPYATLMVDAAHRITSCGAAAATLFGYAARALIGQHISIILPGLSALQSGTYAGSDRLASVRLSKIQMDAVHSDGASFPVLISLLGEYDSQSGDKLVFVRNLVVPAV